LAELDLSVITSTLVSLDPEPTVEPTPAVEPVRLLLPSPIGTLGLELQGAVLTRLVLSPPPKERKLFQPLGRMGVTDEVDEVVGRLSEYFAGARRGLELEYDLGPSGVDAFARRVLKETTRVGFGRTRTYKEIAAAVGRPTAYRLVVSILLANPIPILLPCHRVVPSKAGIGGYVGGEAKKRWLLRLERMAPTVG
jgi:methylated-DNA-[protein]-cysteine S-methyltransferase